MAGIHFKAITPMITLTAATPETVLQIVAATNTRTLLHGLLVSFNGITAADPPIQVDVFIQTTAGTMSSLTLSKNNVLDTETLQTTAQHTATAEPTNTTIKSRFTVHEQTQFYYMPSDGPIPIPGGTKLGVVLTPGALVATTKVSVQADCEE